MKKLLFFILILPLFSFSQIQIGQDIDGENLEDQFGRSIALSLNGDIVAISSSSNNSSGYVRVYENQSGNWVQIGQDISGEAEGDSSGSCIALSSDGTIVAIGAITNDGNGDNAGHVRVYENQSGSWVQIGQDIDGEAVGDRSGNSVSISADGTIVAIGASRNDGNGNMSGHVRVYENQNGTWLQIGQDIDGESSNNQSGWSVSLSSDGSLIAISAPTNSGNGNSSGHVRVYENQNGTWIQIGQDIDGEYAFENSGTEVKLSSDGSVLAIASLYNNVNGSNSGQVRVYENQNGTWLQIGQDINGDAFHNLGYSVSLSSDGSILAAGAPGSNGNGSGSGYVGIYKNQNGNWILIGQYIEGEAASDAFGLSVSLSSDGSIVAVGAVNNDGNGNNSGHAGIYSIASELGLLEVIEDISGNNNGINVTAEQLNAIEGVSGAIDNINYTTALQNGVYIDSNNPTAFEIQAIINQVNASLNVTEYKLFDFQIYPNPTKTQFSVQLENLSELQNINIYNYLGQVVLKSKNTVINTSKLASGLYVVELETTKGKGSKKLIIE